MPPGDVIAKALGIIGIDQSLVERLIGGPCGCKERQDRVNQLYWWAASVVRGKIGGDRAKDILFEIKGGDE